MIKYKPQGIYGPPAQESSGGDFSFTSSALVLACSPMFLKRTKRKIKQRPFTGHSVGLRYCWFSVSRHSKWIKIKIKTVQQIKSRIWEMKGSKYAKTLAKFQVRGIFLIRDFRRNVLPKVIEICMETPCWCPSGCAPTWRTEANRDICYRVFLQKREFILRETRKH